jgi:hypothetical protein
MKLQYNLGDIILTARNENVNSPIIAIVKSTIGGQEKTWYLHEAVYSEYSEAKTLREVLQSTVDGKALYEILALDETFDKDLKINGWSEEVLTVQRVIDTLAYHVEKIKKEVGL